MEEVRGTKCYVDRRRKQEKEEIEKHVAAKAAGNEKGVKRATGQLAKLKETPMEAEEDKMEEAMYEQDEDADRHGRHEMDMDDMNEGDLELTEEEAEFSLNLERNLKLYGRRRRRRHG